MPETEAIENQAAWDYATYNMQQSRLLPLELLRCHRDMDINERDAIRLLRVLAYCYDGSPMRLDEVGAEFGVDAEQAAALLRPYLEMHLLEWHEEGQYYSCQGLRRELYLHWLNGREQENGQENGQESGQESGQGSGQGSDQEGAGLSQLPPGPLDEREEIRALAHLYRRFEQELGRPLRYAESDRLRSWIGEEGQPPQLVEEALKRASVQDKCTLAYIGSILRSWQKKRLTTLELVLAQDQKPPADGAEKPVKKSGAAKRKKYEGVNIN